MPLQLFDTLTREVKALAPADGRTFRFYCCGPTVYGPAHIGNFRTFVLQDVLRRVLELSGTPAFHVRNITDVDDKTIRDSQAAGRSLTDFTEFWRARFEADCAALNLLPPHESPSAVAHIPQQVAMIESLVQKGHAYAAADGSVYFKVASFADYGRLSRLDTRELDLGRTQEQRTSDADEYDKDSVADFVLWKARREADGPNFWPSPWGEGRPGWHLECSAMIAEYLGPDFDLHCGGEDLIFPHHENEIAQSRCACGGSFARHWFHGTHLLVDGAKMSKSLGNLYTLADLAEKGFSANEVRYLLLAGHYRKQLNFTLGGLDDARSALARLRKAEQALLNAAGLPADHPSPTFAELLALVADPPRRELVEAPLASAFARLRDDLNTPASLGQLFGAVREWKKRPPAAEAARSTWQSLQLLLAQLGLVLPPSVAAAGDGADAPGIARNAGLPAEVQALLDARSAARAARDWAGSDRLRDELAAAGWRVIDARDGIKVEPI